MRNLPGYVRAERDAAERALLKESLAHGSSDYMTICEVLRFAYDTVVQIKEEDIRTDLTDKLVDALNMGKKMNSRLAYYKKKYNKDLSGSKGSHLIRLRHTALRQALREARRA